MWNYICIPWLINWSDSTKMHGATIRLTEWLIKCRWCKGEWSPFARYDDIWGNVGIAPPFLNLASIWGECSTPQPLCPWERTYGAHWIGEADLEALEKGSLARRGIELRVLGRSATVTVTTPAAPFRLHSAVGRVVPEHAMEACGGVNVVFP